MSKTPVDFLYELGHLKRVPRSGWALAGIEHPESVAEHSFRTAAVAFLLALQEGADPHRAAGLALFHDLPETRTGDPHHMARRYLDAADADPKVLEDQVAELPSVLADAVRCAWQEVQERSSAEARLVKDADRLECLLQAREYAACGHDTAEWQETARAGLQSPSAREWAAEVDRVAPHRWWKKHPLKRPGDPA